VIAALIAGACAAPTVTETGVTHPTDAVPSTPVATIAVAVTPSLSSTPTAKPFTRAVATHDIRAQCPAGVDPLTSTNVTTGTDATRVTTYTNACFPTYKFHHYWEGLFHGDGRRPLPFIGRTCGHFKVLVYFVDTDVNRNALLANAQVPQAIKDQVTSGDVRTALEALFRTYTPDRVFLGQGVGRTPPVTFAYTVRTGANGYDRLMALGPDGKLKNEAAEFPSYDAVVLLEDIGKISGMGIGRFPKRHPTFYATGAAYVLRLHPRDVMPGLFYNELFRRNMPNGLTEYLVGPEARVNVGTYVYVLRSVTNPRTGVALMSGTSATEVAPMFDRVPLGAHLNGWYDIDRDGITDCVDPEITATADNVDADLIPDPLDPDLEVAHVPFFWRFVP
jgi:hypothetical protein